MSIGYEGVGRAGAGKPPRRGLWRLRRTRRSPPAAAKRLSLPFACYLDMLFVDHGIFRELYANRHRLGEHAWRSAQPAPRHIRALARQGLRTIVNLRGERQCGSYWLEKDACERQGITLINFKVRSRFAPTREEIKAAAQLFERIEYPMLMHCKSGADRAGLMSVLYRFLREGVPLLEAKQELSLRYGHYRESGSGILDRFFERYLDDTERRPLPFLEWVDKVYEPEDLNHSFRAKARHRLMYRMLGRE